MRNIADLIKAIRRYKSVRDLIEALMNCDDYITEIDELAVYLHEQADINGD